MLYIFFVNTGTMLTFDMNLAMGPVSSLQAAICQACHIPEDKQVLLISGGESLSPASRVCSYSAGTDTNPIFLFSKSSIEAVNPPSPSVNYGSEQDLREQVEGSLNMPPTYETVVARAQLARQLENVAIEQIKGCEHLVHDQHLQHQGWAAVIANLEDITSAFKTRSEIFQQNFADYIQSRESMQTALESFSETCNLLSKVPLLPCLQTSRFDSSQASQLQEKRTLLDWISAQDSKSSMESMAEQCKSGLEQFDSQVQDTLKTEISEMIEKVNNPSMKEVKGLEDRLYGLDQIMFGARKIVQEQADMAQGFVANQNRASNVKDVTVLPDLCSSHKKQLEVLLKNHQTLHDIKRRCTLAKEELSANLHARLRWVMYVEKQICDVDSKLVIYHENLKKLRRKLEIIQQIHQTPDLYARAIVETVRRKYFSTHFKQWADRVSSDWQLVQKQEVTKREEFSSDLSHHFLQTLFQGFDELPPTFAGEAPAEFDTNLPSISIEDVHKLQEDVPELADKLRVPKLEFGELIDIKTYAAVSNSTVAQIHSNERETQLSSVPDSSSTQDTPHTKIDDTDLSQSVEVLTTEDIQHATVAVSLERKGSPIQLPSPELEDISSDGFTTADFYIDESMPSSVTESPPLKKIQELQQVVSDKSTHIEVLEKEKAELKEKIKQVMDTLQETEEKCKRLHEIVSQFMEKVRSDHHTLQSQVVQDKENFRRHVDQMSERFTSVLSSYTELQEGQRTSELELLKSEYEKKLADLQLTLEVESGKLDDAQRELSIYTTQLAEASENNVHIRNELESKTLEYAQKIEENTKDITSRLVLEHEVEFEKLKSEYEENLSKQEKELCDFRKSLSKKEHLLLEISEEKENLETKVKELQKETEELAESIEAKYKKEKEELEKTLREASDREISQKIKELEEEKECAIKAACDKLKKELSNEFDNRLETITQEFKASEKEKLEELTENLDKDKVEALESLRKEVADSYEADISRLKEDVEREKRMHKEYEEKQSRSSMSKSQHQEILDALRVEMETKQDLAISQALDALRTKHDEEISGLIQKLEKDKQDSLTNMKASATAEKQVLFNEAVNKVTAEKDKIIEELKRSEAALLAQTQKDRETIDKLLEVESHAPQLVVSDMEKSAMVASVMPVSMSEATEGGATGGEAGLPDQIAQLEMALKNKEDEVTKLNEKLMSLSMSTSSRTVIQDKVSITSCNVGDIVLLCLDERHEQYVVFSVGNTLHFLHTECLQALNLKTGPDEVKKSWVLAEVTDKEYCQAKKPQNRFKVPMGTKFYRVKAKPWTWEGSKASMPESTDAK